MIEDHGVEASICKIVGTETLAYCVDEGVQIYGGAGFIEEYPVAEAYRDERINRIFEGTNEINRMIIGGYILKKSILEEIPIRLCIDERYDNWMPEISIEDEYKEYIKVVEFCRSLMLNITNHLILEYGQDLKNNQWILEPFADLAISFSIIDTTFKRFYSLDNGEHKNNTENIFKLSLANNFYEMLNNARIILEYVPNSDLDQKLSRFLEELNYSPNRIAYKQKIVTDLYNYKKYYLD